jgi:hypothetical protein
MYGYEPRKRAELGALRVMICESEVNRYLEAYPGLTREQVLATMIGAGPTRAGIERELQRISAALPGRPSRGGAE